MRNKNLQPMIEAAILAALALIIDFFPSIKLSAGISISFAMIPIFIAAYRWGVKIGMLSGFLWGLLQIVTGDAYILTALQACIEYFIAFAFIGLAGLFFNPIQHAIQNGNKGTLAFYIVIATLVGSIARYFWHFIAGVLFFGEYAPEGQSAFMYSLIANGITLIGAFAACAVLLVLLSTSAPHLLKNMKVTRKKKIA
ncbi:proton-coupled thiamine transporter YuaJ [Bacillus manliponensis]|uniref:Proton-coupled thiamine transporter YuaJ n=1 Tax=Bacillus manliponensis TaxID=574376 RepID=A0A073K5U0_9BACI|nr:energy-coupled thiamine transporter ThiT [Bacillus manliponensis]KEK17648.1 proton-coupled thiamine transporter YuaJ [Bacillus manliponensis]